MRGVSPAVWVLAASGLLWAMICLGEAWLNVLHTRWDTFTHAVSGMVGLLLALVPFFLLWRSRRRGRGG
jgi:hypothetical protein